MKKTTKKAATSTAAANVEVKKNNRILSSRTSSRCQAHEGSLRRLNLSKASSYQVIAGFCFLLK